MVLKAMEWMKSPRETTENSTTALQDSNIQIWDEGKERTKDTEKHQLECRKKIKCDITEAKKGECFKKGEVVSCISV